MHGCSICLDCYFPSLLYLCALLWLRVYLLFLFVFFVFAFIQNMFYQSFFYVFRDTRSSVLEESLHKLGVEKLSKDDVQKMQWEILEAKIGNWIHYMRIAVRNLWHLLNFLGYLCFSSISNWAWTGQITVCWWTESLWSNVWSLWFSRWPMFCWSYQK